MKVAPSLQEDSMQLNEPTDVPLVKPNGFHGVPSRPPSSLSVSKEHLSDLSLMGGNSMAIFEDFQHDRQRAIVTIVVGVVSGLAVVMSLTAMYVEASVAAYVAFIFPLVVAPYAIHQRRQINKLPTLTDEIKKFRYQVSRFETENIALHANINRMTAQIRELAKVDDELAAVAKANNEDLTALRKLIYTNGNIQRLMTKALQARDLQNLLSTLLACDANKDSVLSNSELDQVLLRLEAFGTRIPKDVLKAALERASMTKQESTTSLYRTIMEMDPGRGCGDFYVQYTD